MVLLVIILAILIPIAHTYVSDGPFSGSISSGILSGSTMLVFLWWVASYFWGGDNCKYIGEKAKPKYYYAPAPPPQQYAYPSPPEQMQNMPPPPPIPQQSEETGGGDW